MIATTQPPPRIATLDIVRGTAVLGILAMNIVAFAMPLPAYSNPIAYGADSALDLAAYAFNFILVDGKMRGLFSFLFGASMLLVIEKAEAAGRSSAAAIVSRQLWLLLFGLIHFYLIWFGDILIGYALIGLIAWFFRRREPVSLVGIALALLIFQLVIQAGLAASTHSLAAAATGPNAGAGEVAQWRQLVENFGQPGAAFLRQDIALHLGPWTGLVRSQLTEHLLEPFYFLLMLGGETLALMLLGMAALKSGFLTGAWDDRQYRRIAAVGFAISVPAFAILAALLFADRFTVLGVMTYGLAATVPFRPVMVVAYAALIILLARDGGWLAGRLAAAGRAAFTNYLGTSIVMTGLFYGWGLGLYGRLGRAELWLVVIAAWIVMLAWSKPWLERFAYGPFEWLWRSLARWQLQPLRRPAIVTPTSSNP